MRFILNNIKLELNFLFIILLFLVSSCSDNGEKPFIGKKIDADTMESLEEALISSDLGVSASQKIVKELEKNYSGYSNGLYATRSSNNPISCIFLKLNL